MEDGVEYTGRTVEDALSGAERQTGVRRDQFEYDVITAGRAGVFGIGAESARIRVRQRAAAPSPTYVPAENTVATPAVDDPPMSDVPYAPHAHDTGTSDELHTHTDEYEDDEDHTVSASGRTPESNADLSQAAATVLRELLDAMGFSVEVAIRSDHDPIMLVITGENLGVLIGRRGDNLSALQFMVNLLLSKNRRQWPRVVIDAENYRARREESLSMLTNRIAYRVRRNGRPFTLEAMPASDRRIIHLALREDEELETYSIGEGISRRVVIAPKQDVRPSDPDRY